MRRSVGRKACVAQAQASAVPDASSFAPFPNTLHMLNRLTSARDAWPAGSHTPCPTRSHFRHQMIADLLCTRRGHTCNQKIADAPGKDSTAPLGRTGKEAASAAGLSTPLASCGGAGGRSGGATEGGAPESYPSVLGQLCLPAHVY